MKTVADYNYQWIVYQWIKTLSFNYSHYINSNSRIFLLQKNNILTHQSFQSPSTSTKHYFNPTVVLNHRFNPTAVSTIVFSTTNTFNPTVVSNICFHPSVDQSQQMYQPLFYFQTSVPNNRALII